MNIIRTIADLRRVRRDERVARVGFVPTMGALHEGHVTLMRRARENADLVAASLFVNPTQFNDASDLAAYPRQEREDAEMAEGAGVTWLFVPSAAEIYASRHETTIEVGGAARGFEGAHRPGHFNGVALVCLKLFNLVRPHVAFFGQKDAQQVAVIKQLVRDVDLDLEIVVVPTVRATDGLALSSRNARLSASDRARALAIPRALRAGLAAHRDGQDPASAARAALGDLDVEYASVATFDADPTLVIAAKVGAVRLIDNVPLDHPERAGLE